MILLCYLFPPLAVLLMGRPFSAVLNLFLTAFFFYVPGVRHALAVYADYRSQRHVGRIVDAVNRPAHLSCQCCRYR